MAIWFDVDDLIRFFQTASRPTGIQRLSFETYSAIWRQAGASGEVRFCRRHGTHGFRAIHFPALEAGIRAASETQAAPPAPARRTRRPARWRLAAARALTPQYRLPLGNLARAGRQAMGAIRDLAKAPWRRYRPVFATHVGGHHFDLGGGNAVFAAGDWFVNLGASWGNLYPPEFFAGLRAQGVFTALLAYDLIPYQSPEWFTAEVTENFTAWLTETVPQTDRMFAISHSTAADLRAALRALGEAVPAPLVLPVGVQRPDLAVLPARLVAGPYVLMVGTIEPRKNHAALLRVWRRLLATLPAEAVPKLVFAGKNGWLADDFMQQLENAGWLGGKIVHLASPTEAELASLYQHCVFSVFPSLDEGWGLPVSESLSYGKMAAASNRAAIREAGGAFCAYFDPENINDMFETIRGLITEPARVAAMEARIAAGFSPPGWAATAATLLAQLGLEEHGVWPAEAGVRSIS